MTGVTGWLRISPILEEEASMRAHQVNAETLRDRILQLESEHSGLDRLIHRMSEEQSADDYALQRLKKRKLKLKDTSTWRSKHTGRPIP